MLKPLITVLLLSAAPGTVALAHHSYADFFRDQKVPVEGVLEQLTLGNPHAIVVVRTDEGQTFTAEWGNALQLQRSGFKAGMLAVGDRIVVTGSPSRDPKTGRMALVTEIRRPRDGWQWTPSGVSNTKSQTPNPESR